MSVHALDAADELIASKRKSSTPSDAGLAALNKILAHNDALPKASPERVGVLPTAEMLRDKFGWEGSRHALEALCVRLGRKSFARQS